MFMASESKLQLEIVFEGSIMSVACQVGDVSSPIDIP